MNMVKYLLVIIFLILLAGCDLMRDGNKVTYQFNIDPHVDLSGLRVNLHISGKNTGSSWYGYSKTITMIDGGKVLDHRFKDDGNLFYTIEAIDSKRGLYFHYSDPYEHDGLRADYIRSFIFSDNGVKLGTQILKSRHESNHFYEKKFNYDKEDTNNKKLGFYNPKTANYQISTVYSQEDLKVFDVFSFEDLKTTDKLKEEDILRLNLTDEQKQELIKIHSQKEFIDP